MSETPTSSLSLRLPVGVSAILSGFMVSEGDAERPAPIVPMDHGPTRQSYSIVAKREMWMDRKPEGNRARQVLAARAGAPVARALGFASFGRSRRGFGDDRIELQVLRFAQNDKIWRFGSFE